MHVELVGSLLGKFGLESSVESCMQNLGFSYLKPSVGGLLQLVTKWRNLAFSSVVNDSKISQNSTIVKSFSWYPVKR